MGVDTEAIDETVPCRLRRPSALPPEKFIVGYAGSVSVSNAPDFPRVPAASLPMKGCTSPRR